MKKPNLVAQISEDLSQGVFTPGSWLKQIDIQERYGATRSAVRKALDELANRRLIRHEPNRGYSIHSVDAQLTENIKEMRIAIEIGFAGAIVERATQVDLDEMRRMADLFSENIAQGRLFDLYETNLLFHRALLNCAGNPLLNSVVNDLRLRDSPAPVSQWLDVSRIRDSAAEHHEMVLAVEKREADQLKTLITRHINR